MPITGPNYYAVQFPMFQRSMRNILTVSQGFPCVIVTTFDGTTPGAHQYSTGLIVRIRIPEGFGMILPQDTQASITVIDDTSFSVPIDTTNLDAFVVPSYNPGHNGTPAIVVPFGEENYLLTQSTQNVLPSGQGVN